MTVQTVEPQRPPRSLRRRMAIGLSLVTSLVLLALIFFVWQLAVARESFQSMQEEAARLTLALETARQSANLVVLVQDRASDHIASRFVEDVSAATDALQDRQEELIGQLTRLPEGDPLQEQMGEVAGNIGEVIAIIRETVNLAEEEDWRAVDLRSTLLLETEGSVDRSAGQVADLIGRRRSQMETRVRLAVQRVFFISLPMVVSAIVIAVLVVFITVRDITVGVEELSRSAARLAEGHFDERVEVTRTDEMGQLAQSFNGMARELQGLYASLGHQVAERTADLVRRTTQLEAAAEVAREAAAIRRVDDLLDRVVHLISERFSFYHAGIFLLDDRGAYAVLQAASSEGGRRMVERGHRLRVGEQGIVGYVAAQGESRIALDVGRDAVFFDNPDLPLTRSEMGLPLAVRGRVIGVLDVQSTQEAAFTSEDVALLQTLADQIALAIENARLLEESQRALAELESLYGREVRESWREQEAGRPSAYHYTGTAIESLPASEVLEGEVVATRRPTIIEENDGRRLVAPIRLRGEVLGSIALRQSPDQQTWSEDEVALMEEVSTQIGLALENARLLGESRLRAAREASTAEVVARVRETLDVDTVLRTAVREIKGTLGLSRVMVRLAPPPRDEGIQSAGEEEGR